MTERVYTAADLTAISMADAVRNRPRMYFRLGPGDPRLATEVLGLIAGHAFHPDDNNAAVHTPRVTAEITADLAFSVTDDRAETLTGQDRPRLGFEGSLFSAPAGAGTRVSFVLDPAFFGSAVIAADLATLDVHGPYCTDAAGPGEVVIRDRRIRSAEYRYA